MALVAFILFFGGSATINAQRIRLVKPRSIEIKQPRITNAVRTVSFSPATQIRVVLPVVPDSNRFTAISHMPSIRPETDLLSPTRFTSPATYVPYAPTKDLLLHERANQPSLKKLREIEARKKNQTKDDSD